MSDLKVAACVPTAGLVNSDFAHSLAALMAYSHHLRSRPGDESIALTLLMQQTSCIHANREALVTQALDWGCSHILFLDDDMVFSPQVLDVLLGRRQPIVVTNYTMKGTPPTFVAVGMDTKRRIVTCEQSTGLEEIHYSGFGVSLFERQVFEQTPKPWFLPRYDAENDTYTTEDLPFFEAARAAGFKCWLDHDASKLIGHRGLRTYEWRDWSAPLEEKTDGE